MQTDGPRTAALVIQQFLTVVENILFGHLDQSAVRTPGPSPILFHKLLPTFISPL